jgi:predicted RNase H-like HicB family nuclease
MAKRQPLDYYLGLQYPFRVDADPHGGYVIAFPDLPGCLTQADEPDEIGPMAEEARGLWIETEFEAGNEIPLPSYPLEYSGKFNLRLPKSLHAQLAQSAEREGVSLNQYVISLIAAGQASLSVVSTAGGARGEHPDSRQAGTRRRPLTSPR